MTETDSSMASRFAQQVGRGRSLIIVAATEVVLFVVANVTYGNGNDKHGPMRTLSNVVWAIFLIGFVVLIVFAIATLVRLIARRGRQGHGGI
jgi:energy-converting hydrogenase Eha subunit G